MSESPDSSQAPPDRDEDATRDEETPGDELGVRTRIGDMYRIAVLERSRWDDVVGKVIQRNIDRGSTEVHDHVRVRRACHSW